MGQTLLADLKLDAGARSVQTVKQEKAKLDVITALELPADLFRGVSPRLLRQFQRQVATEDMQGLQRHPDARRWTLLVAFCFVRRQEIIDTLAELLLDVVQHLGVKAERKVDRELMRDFKRVNGKTTMLYQLAEAAVEHPDEPIRDVLYPVVSEQTCANWWGVPRLGADLPPLRLHSDASLVSAPLPSGRSPAAGGDGVPLQQRQLPADHCRP